VRDGRTALRGLPRHHGWARAWRHWDSWRDEEKIVDDSSIDATVLVAAAQSPNRLVYRTEVLTQPVHISGIPSVSLNLSFNRPAAIVSAIVVDYRADGTAARLRVSAGLASVPRSHGVTR
jgi:X-Pro dipeptidyl-peptidase